MDIQSINDDIKTKQWVERIKACRESGLPVRRWCRQNNICEQTYYCWLKKLRKIAIESGAVKALSFVSVDQSTLDKQNIVITKGIYSKKYIIPNFYINTCKYRIFI